MKWVFSYFSKKNRNSGSSFFTIIRVIVKGKKPNKMVLQLILMLVAPWKIKSLVLRKSREANTNSRSSLFVYFSILRKKKNSSKGNLIPVKEQECLFHFQHLLSVTNGDVNNPKLLEIGFDQKMIQAGWTQLSKWTQGENHQGVACTKTGLLLEQTVAWPSPAIKQDHSPRAGEEALGVAARSWRWILIPLTLPFPAMLGTHWNPLEIQGLQWPSGKGRNPQPQSFKAEQCRGSAHAEVWVCPAPSSQGRNGPIWK